MACLFDECRGERDPRAAPLLKRPYLLAGTARIARQASPPIARRAMSNSLDLHRRPQDTRVVVAMSGGVDCSVTAALLKAEGYDVVGVTLQLYDHSAATHRKGACCAGQDIYDARSVADRIGIPHYVLDYESRFKEAVLDRLAESYIHGETWMTTRATYRPGSPAGSALRQQF
jgi:asparagine synthetase B (glutamine-hydrolysing)